MAIEVAKLFAYIGVETGQALRGLNEFSGQLEGTAERAKKIGGALSAGVTLPLAALGAAGLKTAREYDSAFQQLGAVSDATGAELEALDSKAQALGADLTLPATSAADAAEAMLELARAGLSVRETLDASRGVLQLSAAGQVSNARAAEITAAALNSFNLRGAEATRVADLLAAGANSSAAGVEDMAQALQMSSSVAAQAGVPIEDLTTMIAEMANAGIRGSDAGTSLKTMLMRLQAPTDIAKQAIKDLGVSVYDSTGSMLSAREIIGQFETATAGLTEEQRAAAFSTIFGADAIRAANIVVGEGVEGFDKLKTSVTEQGAAADLAGAQMQGLNGSIEAMKSSLETALLSAVMPFKEDIMALAQGVANAASAFSELDPSVQKSVVSVVALTAAAGPALLAFSGLVGAANTLLPLMIGLPAALANVGAGLALINSGAGVFAVASTGAAGLVAALVPLGLTVAALAAVWAAWDANVEQTTRRGGAAVSNAWTKFFEEQADKGEGAAAVLEQYRAATARVRDEVSGSLAGAIVQWQVGTDELYGSQVQLNDGLARASRTYEEYIAVAREAGITTGLYTEATWAAGPAIEAAEAANARLRAGLESAADRYSGLTQAANEAGPAAENFGRVLMGWVEGSPEYTAAQDAMTNRWKDFEMLLSGQVGPETDKFNARQAELRLKAQEIQTEIDKLNAKPYLTQAQKDELAGLQQALADNQAEVSKTAEAHEDAMRRIAFSMLQARVTADGWQDGEMEMLTAVGGAWGLFDEETRRLLGQVSNALEDSGGEADAFLQIMGGVYALPDKDININVVTRYSRTGDPSPEAGDVGLPGGDSAPVIYNNNEVVETGSSGVPGGFAEGGSFVVPGSGSGDRMFRIGLEPGELVKITPRDQVTTPAAEAGRVVEDHSQTNFYLTAQYHHQDERTLGDELRLLRMLYA